MTSTTEKLTILITTLALFIGGVYTLSLDRGTGRTIALACILGAMLSVAGYLTVCRLKQKK